MKKKLAVLIMALSVILTACAANKNEEGETVQAFEASSSVEEAAEMQETSAESEEAAEETDAETTAETTEAAEFEPGILTEKGYTNEWMGLAYTAPENTLMLTKEQINEAMGLGAAVLEEEMIEAAKQTTTYEMMNVENTGHANVILGVEKLPVSFITIDMYVEAFLAQYTNIDVMNAQVISTEGTVQIAGEEYRELQIDVAQNNVTMHQKYYFRLKDNNVILMILSYTDDSEAADAMINAFEPLEKDN